MFISLSTKVVRTNANRTAREKKMGSRGLGAWERKN
jgi:hypothetical protein